jgi:hypothetical protein
MIRTVASTPAPRHRRVRVWFGDHPIFDYTGTPVAAQRYEQAMRRRFVGLRVTNEPADALVTTTRERADRHSGGGLW